MQTITTKKALDKFVSNCKSENKTIGFVPTMGALHNGHLTLVRRAVTENDICIVSVFVNPTQFNDKNDLANYPRTLEADAALLTDGQPLPLKDTDAPACLRPRPTRCTTPTR